MPRAVISGAGRGAKVDNLTVRSTRISRPMAWQTTDIRRDRGAAFPGRRRGNADKFHTSSGSHEQGHPDNGLCFPEKYAAAGRHPGLSFLMKRYGRLTINTTTRKKFVRVLIRNVCPETKWVEGSNYVDVNFKIDERTGRVIMMGAMDNLVKGAAGQAVQNMNLMFGLPETKGLELVPMFP